MKQSHEEMIEVIAAHKAGKTIQFTTFGDDSENRGWLNETHLKSQGFRFNEFWYRVAPEPPKPTAADYLAAHNACGLKVGDKVRVVRAAEQGEMGWDVRWNSKMNECVGGTFNISEDEDRMGFRLNTGSYHYFFPHFVLEKVEPKVIWVNLQEEAVVFDPHYGYDSKKDAEAEVVADEPIRTAVKFIEVLD